MAEAGTGAGGKPSAAPSVLASGMGTASADGVFPRKVPHYQGTSTVPSRPLRVAALSTGQLDDLLTLGIVPVAATRAEQAGLVPGYLAKAYPGDAAALARTADVGSRTSPNLEALAHAHPDLILVNSTLAKLYPQLSKIAPTVVTKGTGIYWKQDFQLVGAAVGKERQAQRVLADYGREAAADGRRAGDAGTALSMVRFTSGRARVYGVSSFTGSIAVDMGLGRPASQRFRETSQDIGDEQLNRADGDWIFYSELGGAPSPALWQSLKGVQAGHAVKVDDDAWYLNAGPTAAREVAAEIAQRVGGAAG
jgi:iron complex transport system substrate-binding protein